MSVTTLDAGAACIILLPLQCHCRCLAPALCVFIMCILMRRLCALRLTCTQMEKPLPCRQARTALAAAADGRAARGARAAAAREDAHLLLGATSCPHPLWRCGSSCLAGAFACEQWVRFARGRHKPDGTLAGKTSVKGCACLLTLAARLGRYLPELMTCVVMTVPLRCQAPTVS